MAAFDEHGNQMQEGLEPQSTTEGDAGLVKEERCEGHLNETAQGERRHGNSGGGNERALRGNSAREASRAGLSRHSAPKSKKGFLGLSNLGNTCFMNSALQCLTHTHGLQKYFRWCSHAYTSKGQSSRQKLLMSFAHWFERDWGKNVSAQYHSPEDILRSIQALNPVFQGYAQQDSQEFLRSVLAYLHEELRREVPIDLSGHLRRCFGGGDDTTEGTDSSAGGCSERKEGDSSNDPETHSASIISELFQGRLVSMVRCLECQTVSKTEEVAYDISVPIPNSNEASTRSDDAGGKGPAWTGMISGIPGKVKSWFYDRGVEITDCLRKFCAPEYLTGKDKYFCEHCKRKHDCEKRIAFKEPPEVLCIHIKRFRISGGAAGLGATKNSRVVTFPVTRCLNLSSFLDEIPQQPVEYRLIGLIQHIGSMHGGHYISYCQHKRKPQEWYEFDDMQVNLVSPEQVERAEPYVLFYQRMVSKANEKDRQDFKQDSRRTQSQIWAYLASHPPSPSSSAGSRASAVDASEGRDLYARAAADEMRHHGPALRNLYRLPPPELDVVFVSKHWYVRLTTMSHPGPLDNFEYLCPHQLLGASSVEIAAEPFMPISRSMFQSLVQKYGGGPAIPALDICTKCQRHLRAYNERKQVEFDLISKYDTKDTGDGKAWYLIDAAWVSRWKNYVRADVASDIRDMCAPGPVTNDQLLDKDNPCLVRSSLKVRVHYIGVNASVWWLFIHVHGGGPAICREDLDIYSAECTPEIEHSPQELRGRGQDGNDVAARISRQFVDECHGDPELYRRRYCSGHAREMEWAAPPDSSDPT